MKPTIQDRILRRECGDSSRYAGVRGLYSDRAWVDDLDIVAELGGHSGCVNALRQVKFLVIAPVYSDIPTQLVVFWQTPRIR